MERSVESRSWSSARGMRWGTYAMVTAAVFALCVSLLSSDFSLAYIASYTSTTLPTVYKITARWGGQQGSLLFWTWLLSVFGAIAAFQNRHRNPETAPYAPAVMATVACFSSGCSTS
jgi:cytochrome c-type biogenesis protein CcmF